MDFIANIFIFLFFPVTFLLHLIAGPKLRNWILLAASLLFFAAGDLVYLPLILLSVLLNYLLGRQIAEANAASKESRPLVLTGVLFNILLLVLFKFLEAYGRSFILDFLPAQAGAFIRAVAMPLGLSYLTFQNIAYLMDVRDGLCEPERDLRDFALYAFLFPKLLTGPIMLYKDMAAQLKERTLDADRIAGGARRFLRGFAKKTLIADTLAHAINPSFSLPAPEFSTGLAWFMLIAYTIQLYFDFSGYTDMALGMGQMLGFRFVENFNEPYTAQSVADFWRRWHISLSSWVREYIFTPLEFNRRRVRVLRQQTHIFIAFLVVGLWHGLTPNFILWGVLHGLALAVEISFLSRWLKKAWRPLRHIYTLSVVLLGWVVFRSPSISYALAFLSRLVGLGVAFTPQPYTATQPLPVIDTTVWLALGAGLLLSTPFARVAAKFWQEKVRPPTLRLAGQLLSDSALIFLLIIGVASIASAGFVGNIYGRF